MNQTTGQSATHPDIWLLTIFVARVLMYAHFMVYSACLPQLMQAWNMSAARGGMVVSGFMLGYSASLFLCSWLSDRLGARNIFLVTAVLSAMTALMFGFGARSWSTALLLYTLAGAAQGGLYTPVVILFADRYPPEKRGTAVGYLIASTSVGYAFSLAVSGICLALGGYQLAFVVTGILPTLGLVLVWMITRHMPNRVHPRPARRFSWGVLKKRPDAGWLIGGYVFHSWEMIGMWTWTPAFFALAWSLSGSTSGEGAHFGAWLTAVMHLVGSFASVITGRLSDRLGRRLVMMVTAGICTLLSMSLGWLVAIPLWLLIFLGLVYYFTAIGDSPVMSTALSESVEPGYLGAALAIRSLLGFLFGAIASIAFGSVLDWTSSWGLAFATMGIGGLLATYCAFRYRGQGVPD